MRKAVQFGAGNIGRGFMGQLFWEAGYKTVFIEAKKDIVSLLNEKRRYPLKLLDAYKKIQVDMVIDNIAAVNSDDTAAIASEISSCDVISTAVGIKVLEPISFSIAEGLKIRFRKNPNPVDIYLCENTLDSYEILKKAVLKYLDYEEKKWVIENVGFVGTIVARMVPSSSKSFGIDDPLFVVADAYHMLPYDGSAIKSLQPEIEGMHPVDNFTAEFERKLYTYNLGHAALGYLGYLKGYDFVHEPFSDSFIEPIFNGALDETSMALAKKYPDDITMKQQKEIRADVVTRFGNPMLGDTVVRVARDPIRKLGSSDRIIGSIKLCLDFDIFPENIIKICAAAYNFDSDKDSIAVNLQNMINTEGIEKILEDISDINPQSPEGLKIIKYFYEFKKLRKEK
ncbi:MAG: hypothetical protein JW997_04280 [Actinobacteria bacterium]|nr:hypothetical protein [Actinomycetota bacterium]